MHIEIKIKTFPDEWKCFCGNKPKYSVLLKGYPEHLEPPYGYHCCENCITKPLKDFENIFIAHEEFEHKYEEEIGKISLRIRSEKYEIL